MIECKCLIYRQTQHIILNHCSLYSTRNTSLHKTNKLCMHLPASVSSPLQGTLQAEVSTAWCQLSSFWLQCMAWVLRHGIFMPQACFIQPWLIHPFPSYLGVSLGLPPANPFISSCSVAFIFVLLGELPLST